MTRERILICVLLLALVAPGCVAASKVTMTTRSVAVTPRAEQPMPPGFEAWARQDGDLLKITLSSSRNVREAMNSSAAHVGFDAWFCADKREVPLYMPYVYDSSGLLGEDTKTQPSSNTDVMVYIALRSSARSTSEPTKKNVPGYDLKTNPRDICLRVNAFNMAARGFRSQVVRVTAADIAAAAGKS